MQHLLGPFAAAIRSSAMAMLVTDAETPGAPIVFANNAYLGLTGHEHDAITDLPVDQVLPSGGRSPGLSALHAAMATAKNGVWDMLCHRADESTFPARVFLTPLRDEQDGVRQHLLSIVATGATEDQGTAPTPPLPALFENAPGFIATSEGPKHRFTFVNDSYKTFVGRQKLVGKTVAETMPELVEQGIIDILDEVYRTGEPFVGSSMPLKLRNPDTGDMELRCVDVVYQPIRDSNGAVTGLFCEGYDVTARHAANEELAALQSKMIYVARVNAMGTMAATLAHELNQPLSAIGNYVAGVRTSEGVVQDPDRLARALTGIDEASQRASGIVKHLRELTRRYRPTRTTFDLYPAVSECVRLVRATTCAETQFVLDIREDQTITADRVKIQQVIINLLLNACEAMAEAERGTVTITAREVDQGLCVSVADTGAGISSESADTIFSWSFTSKSEGMGLGLSISRTILDMHRGSIWLERNSRQGAEFCFLVPQPKANHAAAAT